MQPFSNFPHDKRQAISKAAHRQPRQALLRPALLSEKTGAVLPEETGERFFGLMAHWILEQFVENFLQRKFSFWKSNEDRPGLAGAAAWRDGRGRMFVFLHKNGNLCRKAGGTAAPWGETELQRRPYQGEVQPKLGGNMG